MMTDISHFPTPIQIKGNVSILQYGHANFPLVFQLDTLLYPGKSVMVKTKAPCKKKVSSFDMSYVSTLGSHS